MKEKFRDIRLFEIKPKNYTGEFDGIFGKVYLNSFDAKNIGYRIAKKLDENNLNFANFDHLYIYLDSELKNEQIIESQVHNLGWNKDVYFGLNFLEFNKQSEEDRNTKIENIIFSILKFLCKNNSQKNEIIEKVEKIIKSQKTETEIFLKEKLFKNILVQITFKINPKGKNSVLIVRGIQNQEIICQKFINLIHYEDAFYIVDKIKYIDNQIIIEPKTILKSLFVTEKYDKPIIVEYCDC